MFCNKIGRNKPKWTESAKKRLLAHEWPGNVRELRNIVERIAYLTAEDTIDDSQIDFVRSPRGQQSETESFIDLRKSLADATSDFQIRYIEEQIKAAHRNVTQAAELLKITLLITTAPGTTLPELSVIRFLTEPG